MIAETVLIWLAGLPLRWAKLDHQRWKLLRAAGVRIEACEFRAPFNLTQFGKLSSISIGRGTFVNVNLRVGVGGDATVSVGRNCAIGPNVSFETMGHNLVWTEEGGWGGEAKSIVVGDRCWLGARVIVLGGVTIGEGSVVAAGAVVTKDIPPHSLAVGLPARVIRNLRH